MTHFGPTLETDRLILRPPCAEDFDGFAELQGDAEASRFIGGPVTRAEAWRRFLWQPGAWFVQGFGMFGVIEKDSGLWMGQIGPWKPEGWPGNEIGYAFHPRAWGKGYATEAGVAAIDWALDGDGDVERGRVSGRPDRNAVTAGIHRDPWFFEAGVGAVGDRRSGRGE